MEILQTFGLDVIRALQTLSPALDGLMRLFSFLGKTEFYMLSLPLIYWAIDDRLGIRLLFILLGSGWLNSSFKLVFHQPRPYWIGGVKALAEEATYGLPSMHASDALAIWGYLAYGLRRTWVWCAAGVMVVCVSFSRLYLGVHFPHDVVLGWCVAAGWLGLFIAGERFAALQLKPLGGRLRVGLGVALVAAIIGVGLLLQVWLARTPDPAAWSAWAAPARTATYTFTITGALTGVLGGYSLMKRHAYFQIAGAWPQRLGRCGFGLAGILLIYVGLDVLFALMAADETPLGYALRYLRYALVAFWVTFVAPWIFLKLKLADRRSAGASS